MVSDEDEGQFIGSWTLEREYLFTRRARNDVVAFCVQLSRAVQVSNLFIIDGNR